jgi:hypothetical protein
MTTEEKVLYHQIHPTKLLTDISTALASLYLLWVHSVAAALLVAFVPPIVVSLILIRYVDLTAYRQSALGRYVRRYMTRPM